MAKQVWNKTFNSKTITIKTNSVWTWTGVNLSYSKEQTELRHDALTAIFNSANPLREGYENLDYKFINKTRDEIFSKIAELELFLKKHQKKGENG